MFTRNKQQMSAVQAKMWLMCCFTLFICLGVALPVTAIALETQTTTLSVAPADPVITDDPIVIGVDYSTSDNNSETKGVTIWIHYDSSKITYSGFDNFLQEGMISNNPDGFGGAMRQTVQEKRWQE